MGRGIAMTFLNAGVHVTLLDTSLDKAAAAKQVRCYLASYESCILYNPPPDPAAAAAKQAIADTYRRRSAPSRTEFAPKPPVFSPSRTRNSPLKAHPIHPFFFFLMQHLCCVFTHNE